VDETQRQQILAWAAGSLDDTTFNRLIDTAAEARARGGLRAWQEDLFARLKSETGIAITTGAEFADVFEGVPSRKPPPPPAARQLTLDDVTREFALGDPVPTADRGPPYTLQDGKVFYAGSYLLRGADVASFRFYLGAFAKDKKACYCTSTRLAGANPATFRAVNFTYATDGQFVWTMGGKVKDADAATFTVCDDGVLDSGTVRDHPRAAPTRVLVPHSYGKDKDRVFYYDFDGKPNWVRKADTKSFVSLGDGYFGKDDQFVFCGAATLPKATVGQWRKIGGFYSKDDARIYYLNRPIREADFATFEVVPSGRNWLQLAKDKERFYNNDQVIDAAQFEELIKKYSDRD
jgi:DKNYY family